MPKEDNFVEESGGYEPGQSSHPVDFSHRGEHDESNYVSHNLDNEVIRQSGESSIIHDIDVLMVTRRWGHAEVDVGGGRRWIS